jgi:PAS domain S-box-containing protein
VTSFNRAAEIILGIPVDDVLGRPCQHILRFLGNDLQHMVRLIKRGETPMVAYEIQPELPSRGAVWLRVSMSPLKDSRDVTTGVAIVVDDLTEMRQLEARARRIRGTFERYVSPALVDRLLSSPETVRLGGVRQEVTSLYADIRGFTAFSENTSPEFQIEVLNQHLTLVAGAILAHEGTLDKFVGDGAMAIFNAPVEHEDHTLLAVRAALATQRAVREYHAQVALLWDRRWWGTSAPPFCTTLPLSATVSTSRPGSPAQRNPAKSSSAPRRTSVSRTTLRPVLLATYNSGDIATPIQSTRCLG